MMDKIEALVEHYGSKTKFADALGVNKSSPGKWLSAQRNLSEEMCEKITLLYQNIDDGGNIENTTTCAVSDEVTNNEELYIELYTDYDGEYTLSGSFANPWDGKATTWGFKHKSTRLMYCLLYGYLIFLASLKTESFSSNQFNN